MKPLFYRHIYKRYGGVDIIAVDLTVTGLVIVMRVMESIGKIKTARVAVEFLFFTFTDRTLLLQDERTIEKPRTVPHQGPSQSASGLLIER